MLEIAQALYLTDILHVLTQALLAPVIILLLLFMGYALFIIGSIIVEAVTERRNFKVAMPKLEASMVAATPADLGDVVIDSGLLRRQKVALLVAWEYRVLPAEALESLAKRLLSVEELRYDRISGRTDAASRLAPMLGLMGTLIPLGPGIVALGQGQTDVLAASIGVAFDTTVAGLAAAAVAFVVSKIRRNWYENYMDALEAAMTTLLEKIAIMRETGAFEVCHEGCDVEAIVQDAYQEMRDKGISLKELAGQATKAKGAHSAEALFEEGAQDREATAASAGVQGTSADASLAPDTSLASTAQDDGKEA